VLVDALTASFDQSPVAMFVTDGQARIVAANQAFLRLSGYTADQLVGAEAGILKSGRHSRDFFTSLWADLHATGSWSGEIWNRHRSGRVFASQMQINGLLDGDGRVSHYLATVSDVTARKRDEDRGRHARHVDLLTGLPNELLFLDRLGRAFARHRRDRRPMALALINVDGFQIINDNYGFEAGDELLRAMTARLKTCVRDSDTIARLDGDQFGVMLPDLAKRQDVALIARKLLAQISDTYELGYHQRAFVSIRVGLAILPGDGTDAVGLMRAGSIALSHAKALGRNAFAFYAADMNAMASHRLALERDLHDAIAGRQFELHFQPIVESAAAGLIGGEALIRWNRPGHGLVPPADFLPLAEETGLIAPIGDWVIEEVVDTLLANRAAGMAPVRISVNISPRQLRDSDIFERMKHRLEAAGIPVNSLELEISEAALQTVGVKEGDILQKIAGFGIDLSIDNYGAGYSSLQQLRKMSVKTLKIDKLVMRKMGTADDEGVLTEAILAMARTLGIRTVAEGIETETQWQAVRDRNCDFGQGFLFGRPLSKVEFLDFIRQAQLNPAAS